MGLTQKLGTIPLAIQTDSSNNVGIGGAANASYKLDVTGTIRATGSIFGDVGFRTKSLNGYLLKNDADSANLGGLVRRSYWAGGAALDTQIFAETGYGIFLNVNGSSSTGMVINSSGQVGINTSTPARLLDVRGPVNLSTTLPTIGTTSGAYADVHLRTFSGYPSAQAKIVVVDYFFDCYSTYTDGFRWFNYNSAGTTPVERFRITGDGKVLVNTTDTGVNAYLYASANSSQPYPIGSKGIDAVQGLIGFFDNANNNIGSIFRQNSSTQYNTSSDYRLKEDFKEVNGLEKLLSIKVYDFKWKNYDYRTDGVLAHELAEILPYAVTGKKDDLEDNGNIKAQGVDYSKLVPVLIKAVQELSAKVTALENK